MAIAKLATPTAYSHLLFSTPNSSVPFIKYEQDYKYADFLS